MFSDTELGTTTLQQTTDGWRTWLPWALCALLFVCWVGTITLWHLKDQLTEAAFLGDTRRDLLQAMQQVGQSLQQLSKDQQGLSQRVQALEGRKPEPKGE